MSSEKQYIDLFEASKALICSHSAAALNAVRDQAFDDFKRQGFPSRKVERYKYTDMAELFAPDYGLTLSRLDIPVDPYSVFSCDVPNLSTSLYFVVNDSFYKKALPKVGLPEGVEVMSLKDAADERPELVGKYYGKIAKTSEDAVTALNTMLAQDGLFIYVPRHVRMDRKLKTDFGAFWQECEGQQCSDRRFYIMPVAEYRKSMEELKPSKRAQHRRRFAKMDELEAAAAASMSKFQK